MTMTAPRPAEDRTPSAEKLAARLKRDKRNPALLQPITVAARFGAPVIHTVGVPETFPGAGGTKQTYWHVYETHTRTGRLTCTTMNEDGITRRETATAGAAQ